MRHGLRRLMAAMLLLAALDVSTVVAEPKADDVLEYYVVNALLSDLLLQIGRDAGLEVEFDFERPMSVTSTSLSGAGRDLMEQLVAKHDLSHFVFNGKSYLGLASAQQARIVRSDDYDMEEMLSAVDKSGLDVSSYAVMPIANPKAFILTAPPRMIAIVETMVASLPPKSAPRHGGVVVRRGVTIAGPAVE